jgi:hypothetical protein
MDLWGCALTLRLAVFTPLTNAPLVGLVMELKHCQLPLRAITFVEVPARVVPVRSANCLKSGLASCPTRWSLWRTSETYYKGVFTKAAMSLLLPVSGRSYREAQHDKALSSGAPIQRFQTRN